MLTKLFKYTYYPKLKGEKLKLPNSKYLLGLYSLEKAFLTKGQVNSAYNELDVFSKSTKGIKFGCYVGFFVFFSFKSEGNRMGGGKANCQIKPMAKVKMNQILFGIPVSIKNNMNKIAFENSIKVFFKAAKKLPVKTKLIINLNEI